jgi:hypothetical protein
VLLDKYIHKLYTGVLLDQNINKLCSGVLLKKKHPQAVFKGGVRVPLNKACGCFVQLHLRTKLASVFVQQHL